MEVRVISKKLIKPLVPTPNHLKTLKLSFLDQLAPAAFSSFIFYYPCNGSEREARLKRLESSLSEILTRFYPLAGRYIKDNNSIDCNDEGVEYSNAQVNGQLARFLEQNGHQQLNRLVPFENEVVAFSQTILAVQVNIFECGGLAIGVSLSHKVADGFSVFSFIQEWGRACKFGLEGVVCPNFDMGILLPSKLDTCKFSIPLPEGNGANMVTKHFVFSGETISKLEAMVIANGLATRRHPSRVEVVIAAIWKAKICAAQAKHRHLRPSLLALSYNIRGKTSLGIPHNAFGNMFRLVLARYKPTDTKLDFPNLVGLVGDAISRTIAECSNINNVDDLFSSAANPIKKIHESLTIRDLDVCAFTSLCRFPYYETDFGWGKPACVSSVHKPVDIVLMMDTKCGTGVEAWVSLEENEMLLLQQDLDLMSLTSKL